MEKHLNKQEQEVFTRQTADDEIDLVDLFFVLWKRKILICVVFIVCLLIGGGYAFMRPTVYEYLTTMEIGTTITQLEGGDGVALIESPISVLEKVRAAYIPLAAQEKNKAGQIIKITASSPKESLLVLLKSQGSAEAEQKHRILHTIVFNALLKNHRDLVQPKRDQITAEIAMLKNKLNQLSEPVLKTIELVRLKEVTASARRTLDALVDQAQSHKVHSSFTLKAIEAGLLTTVESQKFALLKLQTTLAKEQSSLAQLNDQKNTLLEKQNFLEQEKIILSKQSAEINRTLEQIAGKRLSAPGEVEGPLSALSLMMIESQFEQYRIRQGKLLLQVEVNIPRQKVVLDADLESTQRQILIQQTMLADLRTEIAIKQESQQRQIKQEQNVIQEFKNNRSEKQTEFVRQREEKQHLILDSENRLKKHEFDHRFAIETQRQVISVAEARLRAARDTKELGGAIRSVAPVGQSKALIVALFAILGLMGGVMLAFVAEFMTKVRRR